MKNITKISNIVSQAISLINNAPAHSHDVEDDGNVGGFEISLDGVDYAGGSYFVQDGNVYLVSITNEGIIGTISSSVEDFITGIKTICK